jgi:hypothetical protein
VAHGEKTRALWRLEKLAATLLPPRAARAPRLGALRYQLLTAAAGAITYANETKAARAVLVIHEFVTARTVDALHEQNDEDLRRFVTRMSAGTITKLVPGQLALLPNLPGNPESPLLYIGKAQRNLRGLADRR